MAVTAARLQAEIDAETSGLERGMDRAESRVQSFPDKMRSAGRRMRSAGMFMSAALTAPILLGAGKAISAASDINESINKTEVTFGKSAKTIMSWSETSSSALLLTQAEALESAASFGNMFRTIGVADKASAKMSQSMVQLASDMASFHNQDPTAMLERLQSGLAGEAEPLRRFGVLLSAAAVQEKAVKMGLVGVGEELSEQQKVQARYALMLEQTKSAQGDVARTADSWANVSRRVRAELGDLAAQLGKELLPVVTPLLEKLSGAVGWFKALSPAVKRTILVVGGVAAALGPLLFIAGSLVTALAALAPVFAVLTGPVGLAVVAVVGLTAALWKLTDGFKPIRDLIDQVTQGEYGLIKAFKTGMSTFGKTWEDMNALEKVMSTLGGAFQRVVDFAKRSWPKVQAIISSAVDAITAVVSTAVGVLTELWGRFGSHLIKLLVRTWARIQRLFGGALDLIQGIFETFAGIFTGDWKRVWNGVKQIFRGATRIVREIFAQLLDMLKTALGAAVAVLSQIWSGLWRGVRAVLEAAWRQIKRTVSSGIDSVVNFLRELPGRVMQILRDLSMRAVIKFATMIVKIKNRVERFVDDVVKFFKDLPGRIVDALGDVAGKIKEKFTFDLPSLSFSNPFAGGDGPGLGGKPASGWQAMYGAVQQAFPGTPLISGYRPGAITSTGNQSYHALGRAVDLAPSMAIFEWIRRNYGAQTKELIFTPAGSRQIHNGQPHVYSGITAAQHWDHVHWAMDRGGMLPEGLSLIANRTGSPEPVLSPGQWKTMRRAATGGGTHVEFNIDARGATNPAATRAAVERGIAQGMAQVDGELARELKAAL